MRRRERSGSATQKSWVTSKRKGRTGDSRETVVGERRKGTADRGPRGTGLADMWNLLPRGLWFVLLYMYVFLSVLVFVGSLLFILFSLLFCILHDTSYPFRGEKTAMSTINTTVPRLSTGYERGGF